MRTIIIASLLAIGCTQIAEKQKEALDYCSKAKATLAQTKEASDKLCKSGVEVPQAQDLCKSDALTTLETQVVAACGAVESLK